MTASSADKQVPPNPAATIEALRKEAKNNVVFNAICHLFAMRERGRQQVTVPHLRLTLSHNGFHFTRAQVESSLQLLARLGIGRLSLDRGNILALSDIKVTLQSIGAVALGSQDSLEKLASKIPQLKLADQLAKREAVKPIPATQDKQPSEVPKTTLTFNVGGRPITLAVPTEISPTQLHSIIEAFYSK